MQVFNCSFIGGHYDRSQMLHFRRCGYFWSFRPPPTKRHANPHLTKQENMNPSAKNTKCW